MHQLCCGHHAAGGVSAGAALLPNCALCQQWPRLCTWDPSRLLPTLQTLRRHSMYHWHLYKPLLLDFAQGADDAVRHRGAAQGAASRVRGGPARPLPVRTRLCFAVSSAAREQAAVAAYVLLALRRVCRHEPRPASSRAGGCAAFISLALLSMHGAARVCGFAGAPPTRAQQRALPCMQLVIGFVVII